MPHFGLLDERHMDPAAALLQRSRLHLRGARRRIRQGKLAAGVSTLYDTLIHAMQWHARVHGASAGLDLEDDAALFRHLAARGAVSPGFDFEGLARLTEQALEGRLPPGIDPEGWLAAVEGELDRLGVLPFDEAALPPEDPATF
ncbi:hypothetical protein G3N55_00775 [Dissulfurirhabdus thermomarina]|uniref:Uncharacterized protein n=1 Tax=Dissulfurirhabdus thermomarina TaxID=1765737 RepID=A0A6N9TJF6_DISTH|nr:hypothetical protein [Dissulfurirhabdus thermomarina]NDY41385.1 hypothetical protein [Dissulfurirhabdus thermomarina]NMX23599.1 hypothetical protein [Dissulfurirhabdus thermomarina]